jgi:hypothetical protein
MNKRSPLKWLTNDSARPAEITSLDELLSHRVALVKF